VKLSKSLFECVFCVLTLAFANAAFAVCSWESGDQVCNYYTGGLCPNTNWCAYEDCYGKNFGEEIMLVPGGVYPQFWVTRTDGSFFPFGTWQCNVAANPGVTLIEIPNFADGHAGCVAGLETDGHWYLEFFGTNPETDCVAWVECQCG